MAPSPGYRPDLSHEQSWILRTARRLLGRRLRSAMDSQDLSQEAQLAAIKDLDQRRFENHRAFRGWLRRILSNRARDAARIHERVAPLTGGRTSSALWSDLPSREPSPSWHCQNHSETGDFSRALARLPERPRTVLRLRLAEGLSFAEIGVRLQLSEVNARLIFHRAVKELRQNAPKP